MNRIRVFISYDSGDFQHALKLYEFLKSQTGIEPWLKDEDLLPGQVSESIIPKIISESRYFIVLISSNAVKKRCSIHTELKIALKIYEEFPENTIFIIPVRINECDLPDSIVRIKSADLFSSHQKGFELIIKTMRSSENDVYQIEYESYISLLKNFIY